VQIIIKVDTLAIADVKHLAIADVQHYEHQQQYHISVTSTKVQNNV
jgi:hypothetical protein